MKETNQQLYARQGFGGTLQLTPPYGLLLVDFVVGFTDPEVLGGGNIGAAVEASRAALAYAREQKWPVAHTRIVFADDDSDVNVFATKSPGMLPLKEHSPGSQIVPVLTPVAGELVVRKKVPSAFWGTDLAAWLAFKQVNTLLIAGCVTSGCVRASVVDAMSCGFKPVVLRDCVGDRAMEPHHASLFDLQQKYAEVIDFSEFRQTVPTK